MNVITAKPLSLLLVCAVLIVTTDLEQLETPLLKQKSGYEKFLHEFSI
jgi:hypothetical protein